MRGEQEHGPRLDEIDEEGMIRMSREEHRRLLNENARLNDQVREIHEANTALVEERRATKATDRAAMVRDFLERATPWQERRETPGLPSSATLRFRVRLVLDEVVELLDALYDDRAVIDQIRACFAWFLDVSSWRRDLFLSEDVFAGVVHEAVDVAYTIEGMLATLGVDGTAVFRLVDAANKAKAGGGRDDSGKLRKPEGWTPPDVAGELRRQSLAAGRKGHEDEGSDVGRVDGCPEVKSGVVCPLCRGKKTGMRVDAIEADGTLVNPRPAACIACDGSGEVDPDEEDSGDPRDAW